MSSFYFFETELFLIQGRLILDQNLVVSFSFMVNRKTVFTKTKFGFKLPLSRNMMISHA